MIIKKNHRTILLSVKYKIRGSRRFLSHAETLRVFQRAFVRAGIKLVFTEGFNPRPKISLPLPRPVGIESDDELMIVFAQKDIAGGDTYSEDASCDIISTYDICEYVKKGLSEQLPEGFKILSVEVLDEKTPFTASCAAYLLKIKPEYFNDVLKKNINKILNSDEIILQRQSDKCGRGYRARQKRSKMVDVRGFLRSIDTDEYHDSSRIMVNYEITSAGTIRVQEVLELLKLNTKMLAAPIKRTNVQWKGL